jgi:hypothetical protein
MTRAVVLALRFLNQISVFELLTTRKVSCTMLARMSIGRRVSTVSDVEKAFALLHGLTRRDLERLPADQRQRLAASLRRIADLADPPALHAPPRSGVLFELHSGNRAL